MNVRQICKNKREWFYIIQHYFCFKMHSVKIQSATLAIECVFEEMLKEFGLLAD